MRGDGQTTWLSMADEMEHVLERMHRRMDQLGIPRGAWFYVCSICAPTQSTKVEAA